MSSTNTYTTTFTITYARYMTSKVKTDLKLLQRAYGSPSDSRIDAFGEEAAQLLASGYLDTVTYGFKHGENLILALRYTAQGNGLLLEDDRAGGIPRGVDTTGVPFYSHLTYSEAWYQLPEADRESFEASLPLSRIGAPAPGTTGGYWTSDRNYSSNGSGVTRGAFRPL